MEKVMLPIVLVLMSFLITPLAADDSDLQVDWNPNVYKVVCMPPDSCLYSESLHNKAELLMPQAVNGVRQLNFKAPVHWGRRVGQNSAEDYIELRETSDRTIARTTPRCLRKGYENSFIEIGSQFKDYDDRDYLLYHFMAHELFHVLQSEYPFFDPVSCANVPGWVYEGTATAVGQAAMRKRYPSVVPEKRDERVAANFSGLRRYDKPLPDVKFEDGKEVRTGDMDSYRTSSFWRHLAQAHYKGRYDFLSDYMKNRAFNGDWVAWLRNNVELGTGVHLGMVFGGFLADYAGWGDSGFPGMYFGRSKWLDESFAGCERIFLNKAEAADYVDVDLRPLSGKCIEVFVSALGENGLNAGESAAVQVVATIMSGPPSSRDGLHLSLAASNDKQKFHCARKVKAQEKKGLGHCLFYPDDGRVRINGAPIDARSWNVIAQEKGDAPELRQETAERKGELNNLYTVSYTPVNVSTKSTVKGGADPITVRFYFVLDWAKVEFNGQQPASSGPGKKRTVGSFAEGSDPQTTLPKQDASGTRANSYSLPEQFRPNLPSPPVPAEFEPGKLSAFTVSQQLWEGDNSVSDSSSLVLMPARQTGDNQYELYPLSIGETGNFPVNMIGSMGGEALGALRPGSLEVEEFTDLIFRAHFSGTLCRLREMKPERECPNPIPVSGQIVKAFAGSRLPGYYMTIERTPGTEMYRKAAEQGLAEWSADSSGSPSEPPGPGPAESGDTGAEQWSIDACTCSCDEREKVTQMGEDLKERNNAGEDVDLGEMMALMRCQAPCQREYMVCIMEENERKKAAEKALRDAAVEPGQACSCSCETLEELTRRKNQLEAEFKPGSPAPVDEIMSISNCFQSCMNEFISCR